MNAAQHILVLIIRIYRWVISPAKLFVLGSFAQCRYTPSCSAYALEAIATRGALAGSWLALKRIGRCHPWGGCGHDPVPPKKSENRNPKSETNPKNEMQKTKPGGRRSFGIRVLNLFRISNFEFRI